MAPTDYPWLEGLSPETSTKTIKSSPSPFPPPLGKVNGARRVLGSTELNRLDLLESQVSVSWGSRPLRPPTLFTSYSSLQS